jgi:hypothetical protein
VHGLTGHAWTPSWLGSLIQIRTLKAADQHLTGIPVRCQYARPGAPRSQVPDAILVALATYNTICKWAQGISDTYALGVLAETTCVGVPARGPALVNTALASRSPFRRSVESLRAEGVRILLGPGGLKEMKPNGCSITHPRNRKRR